VTFPVASPEPRGAIWSGRRLAVVTGLVLVSAVAAWWCLRPAAKVPPQVPSAIADDEIRQAVEEARRKVVANPASGEMWGQLGLVLLAHVYDNDAAVCFAEAVRLDPADPRWPYARALIALKREPDQAVPLFLEALKTAGEGRADYQSAACLQIAETLLERWQLDEAAEYFRQELQRHPSSPRAALGLGQIAAARGDAAATQLLQLAQSSEFGRKKAATLLARLARTRGEEDLAVDLEKQVAALPVDPFWPDPLSDEMIRVEVGRKARERKVDWLEKQRRFDLAAQIWLRQLEKDPTQIEAYVGAGINLVRLNDFHQALPLLRKSIALAPDNAQAHYTLALALLRKAEIAADRDQAIAGLREVVTEAKKATELKPDDASAFLLWGRSLKFLGRPEEAIAPLRKGVACNPADFDLQFSLGEALLEAQQELEAKIYLENARELDPKNPLPGRLLDALRQQKKQPTLWIVGDSTVKNGTKDQMGWGDPLVKLFDAGKIKVENHAIGGRSSRTFQTEGRWDKILALAQAGDFVLIQMGHNDGGPLDDPKRARGTLPGVGDETRAIDNPITKKKEIVHTYGWYLRKYITDARAKGLTPILCSPVPHCPTKQVEAAAVEKSNHVKWSAEVAKQEKALFLDLNRIIMGKYAALTPADIKAKYFTAADNTHTSPAGAELNAACAVEGIRGLEDCPLSKYLGEMPK
jgi:rhamnogalacturonan acetylesterase